MKPIPSTPKREPWRYGSSDLRKPPARLADPTRFMAYATHEEMKLLRRYVSDDDCREALDKAPPASSTRDPGRIGTPSLAGIPRRRCRNGGLTSAKVTHGGLIP